LLVVTLVAWVLLIYGNRLQLVAFDQVYDEVRANGGAIEAGTGVSYAVNWLAYLLLPLLLSIALARRNILIGVLASAGFLLMYSTSGLRSIAVSIITLPTCYFTLTRFRNLSGYALGIGMGTILLVLTGLSMMFEVEDVPGLHTILSIVLMRTAGTTGYLMGLYHDFFQANPLTYFTHLKIFLLAGVGAYNEQLGVIIGRTYTTSSEICMNANFWATDGLAALGLLGIPIISVVVAFVCYVVDWVSQRQPLVFVVTSLLPIIILMCNISIFTTMLTGGLVFWIGLMIVMPARIAERPAERKGPTLGQMSSGRDFTAKSLFGRSSRLTQVR